MKLFAAFIWFYLRILPLEKADFCGTDGSCSAIRISDTKVIATHDRDTCTDNWRTTREGGFFRRRLFGCRLQYLALQNYRNISLIIALSEKSPMPSTVHSDRCIVGYLPAT